MQRFQSYQRLYEKFRELLRERLFQHSGGDTTREIQQFIEPFSNPSIVQGQLCRHRSNNIPWSALLGEVVAEKDRRPETTYAPEYRLECGGNGRFATSCGSFQQAYTAFGWRRDKIYEQCRKQWYACLRSG